MATKPTHQTKIQLQDSILDIVTKMSKGNPGAATVILSLIRDGGKIDPDNAFEGIGPLLSLDEMGVYGSEIWVLFKDVCGQSLVSMLGVMRAAQLGFISDAEIVEAIRNRTKLLAVAELVAKVKERLPAFGQT